MEKKSLFSRDTYVHDLDAAYLSDCSPKDKVWDKHRNNCDLVRNNYEAGDYEKIASRMAECSRILDFALTQGTLEQRIFKLKAAKFCRVRLCPVCQWRRSLMWVSRFYKVIPKIRKDYPNHKFIFLTLTVENCPIDELRETINWMHKAWRNLVDRKIFPGIGWIRSTEVTKSKDGKAHPHFHCMILVPKSYFKSRKYINQKQWTELWKKSLKVDYDPIVDVRTAKLKPQSEKRLVRELDRDLNEDERTTFGLIECLKYSVKESDLINDVPWLIELTKQLHKTRAIALGGVIKEYLSKDEPEDLVHTDMADIELLDTLGTFRFGWKEDIRRYQSI